MTKSLMAGHKRRKPRAPSRRQGTPWRRPCRRTRPKNALSSSPVSDSPTQRRPGFYEFFCGGGMARAGLGDAWRCLFANDFDPRKARAYADNWGAAELRLADVATLRPADLPGRADLAWASFPCQDLSLAGAGAGLSGARSSAFWGFHALMGAASRRRPRAAADRARERARPAGVQGRRRFCRLVPRAGRSRLPVRRADDRRRAFRPAVASAAVPRRARRRGRAAGRTDRARTGRALRRSRPAPRRRRAAGGAGGALAVVAPAAAAARQSHARRLPRRRAGRRAVAERLARPRRCSRRCRKPRAPNWSARAPPASAASRRCSAAPAPTACAPKRASTASPAACARRPAARAVNSCSMSKAERPAPG